MKAKFFELTLNITMRMIAGKRYYEESAEELEETKKFKEIVMETFELSGSTNIGDFLPIFKWVGLSGLEKRLVILQGKRDKFMQDLIEELRRIRDSSDFECRQGWLQDQPRGFK
nr:isoflavone 3'-hydroxylase [Quercus suber]